MQTAESAPQSTVIVPTTIDGLWGYAACLKSWLEAAKRQGLDKATAAKCSHEITKLEMMLANETGPETAGSVS
jgi:hypothetical protein